MSDKNFKILIVYQSPAKIADAFALRTFFCLLFALPTLYIKRTDDVFLLILIKIQIIIDSTEPLEYNRVKDEESNDIKFEVFCLNLETEISKYPTYLFFCLFCAGAFALRTFFCLAFALWNAHKPNVFNF
jgi:hypothetical protein